MLSATGIVKSYGILEVLKGVDISIARGEIVSIVGSSGAGKSTLLHILGTLDTADKGNILMYDEAVEKLKGKLTLPPCPLATPMGLAGCWETASTACTSKENSVKPSAISAWICAWWT